jgi:phosphoadenosine phosphosulfate reductase
MADKASGPPTRLARWCCEIYKEQGGNGLFQAIGVRAPESQRRKGAWAIVSFHKRDNSPIMCPILYWTDVDIWTFIYEQKMEYCSLYDEGFARLGCIGCPMGGPKGMAKDFARWPHYEKLWKRGFQKYWDRWKGVPTLRENKHGNHDRWIEKMDSVDDLWNWWISGKAYEPPVRDAVTGEETDEELPADCQYNQW